LAFSFNRLASASSSRGVLFLAPFGRPMSISSGSTGYGKDTVFVPYLQALLHPAVCRSCGRRVPARRVLQRLGVRVAATSRGSSSVGAFVGGSLVALSSFARVTWKAAVQHFNQADAVPAPLISGVRWHGDFHGDCDIDHRHAG
jgi:hypothetical protein